MVVRLSALRTGRPLPQEGSWYSFLLEAELTQGHSATGRIRSTKKYNGISIQTCNPPASSIVP
jgi:hypothetical protein